MNCHRVLKWCKYDDISVEMWMSTKSMDGIFNSYFGTRRNSKEAWIESDRCKGESEDWTEFKIRLS